MSALGALVPVVVFALEETICGFPMAAVNRVHPAVEVTLLPGAPPVVDLNGSVDSVAGLREVQPRQNDNPLGSLGAALVQSFLRIAASKFQRWKREWTTTSPNP